MSDNYLRKLNLGFLLDALVSWLISALVLLLVASFMVNGSFIKAGSLGYISSALSFIAAIFAGMAATKNKENGKIYSALLAAVTIVVILLTIGFMINGADMEPSGVLSVVTFTFSGCLVGSLIHLNRKTKGIKKTRFSVSRKR